MRRMHVAALLVPFAVLVANVAGLSLQLLLPRFMDADEYARFALYWSCGQLLASVAYEWTRQSLLRFAGASEEAKSTISWAYQVISLTLGATALICFALAPWWNVSLIISSICFFAVCQGAFEGRQAIARANEDHRQFSLAWLLRSTLSLLACVAAALSATESMVLLVLSLSFVIASTCSYAREPVVFGRIGHIPPRQQVARMFRYGMFAGIASAVSVLFSALVKVLAVTFAGADAAGGMIYGYDLALKIALIVGVAVNITLSQRSFAIANSGTSSALALQTKFQMGLPIMLIAPTMVGYLLVQASLLSVLVPESYQSSYTKIIGDAVFVALMLAIKSFAIDPIFMMFSHPGRAVIGPLVGLILIPLFLFVGSFLEWESLQVVSNALVAAAAVSVLISVILLIRMKVALVPIRDIASIAAASILMAGVVFLMLRGSYYFLAFAVIAGAVSYAAAAYALNILGAQSLFKMSRRGGGGQ